ncbi:hypothetical protein Adt_31905 [Abeliophyllum distichum]|uniref:Protein BIC1 n=1 Tax=Abeliophyllum distichum TaxID=126358 RepID=A0ABD1RJ57_9LAMI
MTPQNPTQTGHQIPPEFKKVQHPEYNDKRVKSQKPSSQKRLIENYDRKQLNNTCEDTVEESGRERLKRHRVDVAGRVWIPDIWGQEDFLKDWIDCTSFDSSLLNNNIMSARVSLVEQGRRVNSTRLVTILR